MYLVLLFVAAALLGDGCSSANVNKHMRLLSELDENVALNEVPTNSAPVKRFLSLTRRPESSYAHIQGHVIHLVCEATGTPAPSIHWFKNDAPVYEFDVESTELIDGSMSSIARLASTLIVTRTSARDIYTCVATTGSKTVRATSVVYSLDGSTEVPERTKLYPLEPQIVVWYRVYVDTIGNNIVLPCRVKGHPRPHVTWLDNNGEVVGNDPRMKVLRSGELVVSGLRWADMGGYTCRATNAHGAARVRTFVYPAAKA